MVLFTSETFTHPVRGGLVHVVKYDDVYYFAQVASEEAAQSVAYALNLSGYRPDVAAMQAMLEGLRGAIEKQAAPVKPQAVVLAFRGKQGG